LSTPRRHTIACSVTETRERERERERERKNGAEQTCLLATTCEHERSAAKLETGAAKLVGETVDSWTLSTDPPLTTDPPPHFSTYLTTYLLTYLPTYLLSPFITYLSIIAFFYLPTYCPLLLLTYQLLHFFYLPTYQPYYTLFPPSYLIYPFSTYLLIDFHPRPLSHLSFSYYPRFQPSYLKISVPWVTLLVKVLIFFSSKKKSKTFGYG
jgi:hypothetical protein